MGPLPETMVGGVCVWDLRNYTYVIIPEGIDRIGSSWFWGSNIESVEIPTSVKYIDTTAFYYCQNLQNVEFVEGSQLEKIEVACFSHSGIEEIQLPRTLKKIGDDAF